MTADLPLICLCESRSKLDKTDAGYVCRDETCHHNNPENAYPVVRGIPVLISEALCDTVCVASETQTYVSRPNRDRSLLKRLIIGESRTTRINCDRFVERLLAQSKNPRVLVIGSGEKGSGAESLWSNPAIEIHGSDIYGSESVDLICDAHYLPLESGGYDGVWIQAVLEHVVEPRVVVAEIFRVLKKGGLVYAETPFMQQVHEGAYDFTRFTVLGHRYLFKAFEAIDFGGNKGPEVVFAWAVRYLVWSLTRSRTLGRILGLGVGILMRPLAYLVSAASLHDAGSGVYFLGRKTGNHTLPHKDLVALYRGQMR